ncbi:predicted protein [Sclerotinia sclerotiorum 1980 UF-70]|uniref:Uncharacterized protein n=2 Tax=Sclerotinia sclerotiorum (strain ATCC 18683 / 1980 / Ss-1) TaxID=665079 RepID=A7F2H2_SCLS1|nr:predicted protein [Sclerotinia sclerotiorum 1980 UF-70]APA09330.1 hypothetical protein sscle_05g041000 [Sclerotinia sclerotiorum 1980 UF-70]EDN95914.1 predicted protein [Sclerotinia sclerotiorum 1980 UF-70]
MSMPKNMSHASTDVVAAVPRHLDDMAEAYENLIASAGPGGPTAAGSKLRDRDHDMSNHHKKVLNSCLQKEIHEHNDTRAKLQHMQAVLMTAEGHSSSLNIYAADLYESSKSHLKRANIAEEALHISRMELMHAHYFRTSLASLSNADGGASGHPERGQIMLTIPIDVKGRCCTCTGRKSQEIINFRLRIPLEVDDGKCVCEGGSGPTIHEIHQPTLIHFGVNVDDFPHRSTPQQGQISPLWLDGNTQDVTGATNPGAGNVHTLHAQRINLVNDNSVGNTQATKTNNPKTDAVAPQSRATTDNSVGKHGPARAGLRVAVDRSGSPSIYDGNTLKSPASKPSDCIEIAKDFRRKSHTPSSQSRTNCVNEVNDFNSITTVIKN